MILTVFYLVVLYPMPVSFKFSKWLAATGCFQRAVQNAVPNPSSSSFLILA